MLDLVPAQGQSARFPVGVAHGRCPDFGRSSGPGHVPGLVDEAFGASGDTGASARYDCHPIVEPQTFELKHPIVLVAVV
jgi:hypothetical protein